MEALRLFLASLKEPGRILVIGDRDHTEADVILEHGHDVVSVAYSDGAGLWEDYELREQCDGVYCSHTLEHSHNVGLFLANLAAHCRPGGVIGIVVPPLKHAIVGGHVSLWNAGLLLYRLVLAGINCREAAVRSYGYNCAVVVRYVPFDLPKLKHDQGDIWKLRAYFPNKLACREGFDGRIESHRWASV